MIKILIFILYIIFNIYCIEVAFDIKPNRNFCFGDYLTEDTVAIFSLKTKNNNLVISLHDPNGKTLYFKRYALEIKVSLTATNSGNYEMCVKNNDNKEAEIEFELLSGIETLDTSQMAKESSIKPAERSIIKLRDMSDNLINDLGMVVEEEEKSLKANDAISGKISMVSILTLTIMILVGLLETIYIKKYLQNRKMI